MHKLFYDLESWKEVRWACNCYRKYDHPLFGEGIYPPFSNNPP